MNMDGVFLGRTGPTIVHVALRIAYDGSQFHAFAREKALHTVEGCLLEALRHEGLVEGTYRTGSRTDAGVSAVENVVSFHLDTEHLKGFVHRVQNHLPTGLWATAATEVSDSFVPRYHAIRTYQYYAPQRTEDLLTMQAACKLFVGEMDMSGFARVESHRNPVRIIEEYTVEEEGDFWTFTISSPGFLWNQVRRMVDATLRVGRGQMPFSAISESLESKTPNSAFKLAPAEGLLLRAVTYKDLHWDPDCGELNWDRIQKGRQIAKVTAGLLDTLSNGAKVRRD